ncbi:MAG: dihydrodipicolinate synthase family protein [Acidobacteria bacterium]|nr:dihydrodipicolinate synthase family protein [Acidobacteriota bacterium]
MVPPGIYTPIVTPFTETGELDDTALALNVRRYLASPLTGLVVLGSNGEAAQLDDDEADRTIAQVRALVPRGRPLFAGTGRESTRATIAATERAAACGVDAVMIRTPSFYKSQMTSDIFVRHFREVADASPVPVILYNVTVFTGVNLAADAVAALSEHPNIVGLKESGTDLVQLADTLSRMRDGFVVLAGSASTLHAALSAGAHGAVLALAGLVPDLCVSLFAAVRAGRHHDALLLQRRLAPLARAIGPTFGVPGLKAALDLLGFRGGAPRAPLRPAPAAAVEAIRAELAALGALETSDAAR